jgi:hypothetical protein
VIKAKPTSGVGSSAETSAGSGAARVVSPGS